MVLDSPVVAALPEDYVEKYLNEELREVFPKIRINRELSAVLKKDSYITKFTRSLIEELQKEYQKS